MAVFINFENSDTYAPLRLSSIPVILGRSSKSGLQLQDSMCSGQHMSLHLSPEGHVIVSDLNSTNGTYINETLISMAAKLFVGDIVRIGDTKFFIDESSLTPKEKNVLVSSSNKTSFTTIGLPSDSDNAFTAAKLARRKALGLEEKSQSEAEPDIIKLDHSDEDLGIEKPKKPEKPSQKLAQVSNEDSDEALFELGESSGNTKMIKLDKIQPARKKVSSSKVKSAKLTKGLKKEKSAGFLSKVKGLFKNDD